MKIINKLLIFCIQLIRPFFGPASCRFEPSCTKYAIIQLNSEKVLKAIINIFRRLISCQPFC